MTALTVFVDHNLLKAYSVVIYINNVNRIGTEADRMNRFIGKIRPALSKLVLPT